MPHLNLLTRLNLPSINTLPTPLIAILAHDNIRKIPPQLNIIIRKLSQLRIIHPQRLFLLRSP